jgi:hypothetical protein
MLLLSVPALEGLLQPIVDLCEGRGALVEGLVLDQPQARKQRAGVIGAFRRP